MRFVSTRGQAPPVTASAAMRQGLAPDGGLYVPEELPGRSVAEFDGASTVAEVGARLLAPFFAGDPLEPAIETVCAEAFDFPVPLRRLSEGLHLLELFHGPTAAFKDFGARFLAASFARVVTEPLTIVVATSGDTGGAVAAAFHRRPNVQVVVLYPKGLVSARQERQLVGLGDNVRAFAVRGVFDDCQALARAAFAHPALRARGALSSANSINVGRLLPQMAYYAAASLWRWRDDHVRTTFVVPSGNLGNATAALWAKRCGLPIDRVVLATNANRTIPEFLGSGIYAPRPTVPTLANAMDVGAPSNLERVRHLYDDGRSFGPPGGPSAVRSEVFPPEALRRLRADVAGWVTLDHEIRSTITRAHADWGLAVCPHTACGLASWAALRPPHAVVAATAHPAKFETVVEPLIGETVPVPPALAALLSHPGSGTEIEPRLDDLLAHL